MKDFERIDTPFAGIDTKLITKNGQLYEAVMHLPPNPRQYVDNEVARLQAGLETAVSRMLRPMLECEAGLAE